MQFVSIPHPPLVKKGNRHLKMGVCPGMHLYVFGQFVSILLFENNIICFPVFDRECTFPVKNRESAFLVVAG